MKLASPLQFAHHIKTRSRIKVLFTIPLRQAQGPSTIFALFTIHYSRPLAIFFRANPTTPKEMQRRA